MANIQLSISLCVSTVVAEFRELCPLLLEELHRVCRCSRNTFWGTEHLDFFWMLMWKLEPPFTQSWAKSIRVLRATCPREALHCRVGARVICLHQDQTLKSFTVQTRVAYALSNIEKILSAAWNICLQWSTVLQHGPRLFPAGLHSYTLYMNIKY